MTLKKPASEDDVANHRETKSLLKGLRHKRVVSRRWHHHAMITLDALWQVLLSELHDATIAERPAIIAKWEWEMEPYFKLPRPPENDGTDYAAERQAKAL